MQRRSSTGVGRRALWRALPVLAVLVLAASTGGETLAPGVEFTTHVVSGPNRVFVVSFERANPDYDLVMGFPFKLRSSQTKERTSAMQARYNAPPQFEVVAAVNGSFFGSGNDITGDLASEASVIQFPNLGSSWPTFAFLENGECRIATRPTVTDNQVRFVDSSSLGIDLIDEDRIADSLVVYTRTWGATTGTTVAAVEVAVGGVNFPMRANKEMSGVVTAVRTGAASVNSAIPGGGVVLSARDSKGTTLQQKVQVGDRITWRIGLSQSMLNNSRLTINGAGWILENGTANTAEWTRYSSGFTGVNPRTMLAWNGTHAFLIAIDGRQPGYSVGMTFQQMADFCTGTLGATDAINLDGGGSTAMVVNGTLRNSPSDSTGERSVGNCVMLVRRGGVRDKMLVDSFPASGRQLAWDDKFTFNGVTAFSPAAPGGDGHVVVVMDPAGGVETVRVGERMDGDCRVEADVYCEYRPEVAGDGLERYGLFARDQGQRAFTATTSGGGNCYVMTFDSDTGRIRAGKVAGGGLTDFREGNPFFAPASGWNRFGIECRGTTIAYYLNNVLFHEQVDTSFATGAGGIGFHELFSTNSNMHGARVDNFVYQSAPVAPKSETWMIR